MKLAFVGWSYKTTPLEVREVLSLPDDQLQEFSALIQQKFALNELVILSTCNRFEIYFVADSPQETVVNIIKQLEQSLLLPKLREYSLQAFNLGAMEHLFRVTSSLESMVLGEPQITGQVKTAFDQFAQSGFVQSTLNHLFPKAFSTAKKIRTETDIAKFAVSISFAAVELAKRIFSDLSRQTVMLIGAGEMAELAAKYFMKNGVSKLLVTNRTFSRALELAQQSQGVPIHFEQFPTYLEDTDIIVGSTGAPQFVVTLEMVKQCLKNRRNRPMFFIDIAVPRDMDPRINSLSNVYCYDIDDLQNVVDQNQHERKKQAELAQQIIQAEVHQAHQWFRTLSVVPTIRALRESFEKTAHTELEKARKKLEHLSEEDQEVIERMLYNVVNKLLHTPSVQLKELSQHNETHFYLEIISQIFNLSPTLLSVEKSSDLKLKSISN